MSQKHEPHYVHFGPKVEIAENHVETDLEKCVDMIEHGVYCVLPGHTNSNYEKAKVNDPNRHNSYLEKLYE